MTEGSINTWIIELYRTEPAAQRDKQRDGHVISPDHDHVTDSCAKLCCCRPPAGGSTDPRTDSQPLRSSRSQTAGSFQELKPLTHRNRTRRVLQNLTRDGKEEEKKGEEDYLSSPPSPPPLLSSPPSPLLLLLSSPLLSSPLLSSPPPPPPPPPPSVPPVAPRPRLQPGVRQHVHQDLVGPHPLHEEGRKEGEEEGRKEGSVVGREGRDKPLSCLGRVEKRWERGARPRSMCGGGW